DGFGDELALRSASRRPARLPQGECAVVHQLEEAARASAMLNVRPARLRNRRHVKAVTVGDEGDFAIGEAVEVAVPLKVPPDAIGAHLGLHGPDAWRHRDIEKSV